MTRISHVCVAPEGSEIIGVLNNDLGTEGALIRFTRSGVYVLMLSVSTSRSLDQSKVEATLLQGATEHA